MKFILVSSLLLSCLLIPGCTPSDKSDAPPGLGYHAMAYDEASDVIVMFGGQLNDYSMQSAVRTTWVYDCTSDSWKKMNPVIKPPASAGHAMAYDAESDRVVLFCGQTWAYDYDADSWEKKNPAQEPTARFGYSMAYDAESDRMILFGVPSKETWVYDLNADTWTSMQPASSPCARQYQSLAYDAQSDRVILFGGATAGMSTQSYATVHDDTWAYDYNRNSWEELKAIRKPEKRVYHAMVYDAAIDRVILLGGWSYDNQVPVDNKVWLYDFESNTWNAEDALEDANTTFVGGTAIRKHAMIYNSTERSIFIYGGIAKQPTPSGEPPFTKSLWSIEL